MGKFFFVVAVLITLMCDHETLAHSETPMEIGKFFQKIFEASLNQIQKKDLAIIESATHELMKQSDESRNLTLQAFEGLKRIEEKLDEGNKLDHQRDEKLKGDLSRYSNLQNEWFTAGNKALEGIGEKLNKIDKSLEIVRSESEDNGLKLKRAILKQELLCSKFYAFYKVTNIITIGKKKYFFKPSSGVRLSWADVKKYCEERRGSMVTIESKSELVSLSDFLRTTFTQYGAWLAAESIGNQAGSYVWPNGKVIEEGHEWWGSGHPKLEKINQKHCVGLQRNQSLFHDTCSRTTNVICELTSECQLD
ncbi:uncharacterized protein LOC132200055 isoform X1 [Neocloeon triangulifer]|uniref:uncharacterized protein LOC132200055 isoform X1 n=1 Tax=Neocloeon triangulifer TaxID=2078957 RepID=UPI00286F88D2|nr:uncharacterized protein LOC132200055 isoform X1 [Neocloeon triangulifer]